MPDHQWRNGWNRRDDDDGERHSGCHRHPSSHQDDEPHERLRGGRSDFHDDEDRGGSPDYHFGRHAGDHDRGHDAPSDSVQAHDDGGLGWDAGAWNDAGGLEAVLFGHLANTMGSAGGSPPIIVFAIEDLDVEFNTLIQLTQVQNTLALLNASDGGSIDIGGDVSAIGQQSASIEQMMGFINFQHFT